MTPISFFVAGTPKSSGSKRIFMTRPKFGAPRPIVTDDNKGSRDWKADVKAAALAAYQGPLLDCALELRIEFMLARPKVHFGSGKNANQLKTSAPVYPMTRPDVDKMSRAIMDSLSGILWRDDALVVTKTVLKRFSDRPGAGIIVKPAA